MKGLSSRGDTPSTACLYGTNKYKHKSRVIHLELFKANLPLLKCIVIDILLPVKLIQIPYELPLKEISCDKIKTILNLHF